MATDGNDNPGLLQNQKINGIYTSHDEPLKLILVNFANCRRSSSLQYK